MKFEGAGQCVRTYIHIYAGTCNICVCVCGYNG